MLEVMDRKMISMARLAKDPEKVAQDIDSSGAVYCITRPGGRTAMMMMDEDLFETLQLQLELARNPALRAQIDRSQRDFAEGRYRTLDAIERELGLDRPAQPSRRSAGARATTARRTKGNARTPRARNRPA
jgi:PHD/YefM family antitoxin component YafN of YafNO toxin-antitoxin module